MAITPRETPTPIPAAAPLLRPLFVELAGGLVPTAAAGCSVPVDEVELDVEVVVEVELEVVDGWGNPTVVPTRSSLRSLNVSLLAPFPAAVPGRRSNQQAVEEVKFKSSKTDPLYGAAGRTSTGEGVLVGLRHAAEGRERLTLSRATVAEYIEVRLRKRAQVRHVYDIELVES